MDDTYVIAIDQGTTSSRAILFNLEGEEISIAQYPLGISYPAAGFVEQDPQGILEGQKKALMEVASRVPADRIAAIGLTNQRETFLCWDRRSGEALYPAIVWQCRRSQAICEELKAQGLEEEIQDLTGLVLDPYFSATKLLWLRRSSQTVGSAIDSGNALFGTVDTWLLYNLCASRPHVTEASNASRTMLFDLHTLDWSDRLQSIFRMPRSALPEIKSSAGWFGKIQIDGMAVPVTAVLGDQQASLYGHGCHEEGTVKCTFGTGAFMLMNCGRRPLKTSSGALLTLAWNFVEDTAYAYERRNSVKLWQRQFPPLMELS